jgi:ABC-type Fe3+/spermidine/putrescine transport system ATPase subunit
MSAVILANVTKRYGGFGAVADLSCEVRDGEFLTLLGPSGCGKTTTLRLVAGLITPDHGRISIGGRDVTRVRPEHRRIGMVFQDYALFPHLTVAENIAFGLRERKVPAGEQARRVVFLPQPEVPSRVSNSPSRTSHEKSATAPKPP